MKLFFDQLLLSIFIHDIQGVYDKELTMTIVRVRSKSPPLVDELVLPREGFSVCWKMYLYNYS